MPIVGNDVVSRDVSGQGLLDHRAVIPAKDEGYDKQGEVM